MLQFDFDNLYLSKCRIQFYDKLYHYEYCGFSAGGNRNFAIANSMFLQHKGICRNKKMKSN